MKRIIFALLWTTETEPRFIWIWGVLLFGGSTIGLRVPEIWSRSTPINILVVVAISLAGGYAFGWLMWRYLRWVRKRIQRPE